MLHSEGRLLIRAEGERHTLLLREAQATDAGSYTTTATNELGQASCASSLAVRPGREPSRGVLVGVSCGFFLVNVRVWVPSLGFPVCTILPCAGPDSLEEAV